MEFQRVAIPGLPQVTDLVGILGLDHLDKSLQARASFVFRQLVRNANAELGHIEVPSLQLGFVLFSRKAAAAQRREPIIRNATVLADGRLPREKAIDWRNKS